MGKPSLSVLVVEDEEHLARLIIRVLENAAHQVTHANCGRAAVDLMEDQRFDVILTDIIMPDGDGLEVTLAAKRWQPQAKIVGMSGGSEQLQAGYWLQLAQAAGSCRTLLKPFTPEELVATIESVASTAPTHVADQP